MTLEKEWTTRAGLRAHCRIVRNSHRCGYVEVPKDHALHSVGYCDPAICLGGDAPECKLGVHGGITYSGELDEDGTWWFGFDCAHLNDGLMIGYSLYGFNGGPIRSQEYVEAECESLARQLMEITK
jgi:hypothetical protein